MNHVDYLGRPIEVGDLIVWASQRGDSPCLCRGVVTALKEVKSEWSDRVEYKVQAKRAANDKWEKDGRIVTLAHMNRIVIVNKAGDGSDVGPSRDAD